jgi:hypothetical protein
VPLIDIVKETVLRTGCLRSVTSVADRGFIPEDVLAERLLFGLYAYGTNTGIRSVAGGDHGHSEEDIRYVRRRYLTPEAAHQIAIEIANATFRVRRASVWWPAIRRISGRGQRFDAFQVVGPEHLHRVAFPLRRAWRADLLVGGQGIGGDPLPAAQLLRVGGSRDGGGRGPPRHRDEGRIQLCG